MGQAGAFARQGMCGRLRGFFASAELLCVSFSVLVPPWICMLALVFIGVWGSSNGRKQPFNQAFNAMRQESDTLKVFLF